MTAVAFGAEGLKDLIWLLSEDGHNRYFFWASGWGAGSSQSLLLALENSTSALSPQAHEVLNPKPGNPEPLNLNP